MRLADWNVLDWLLICILAFSTLMGLRRGFVRTVFGLVGFLAALLLATWKYQKMAELLIDTGLIKSPEGASLTGYLLILVFVAAGIAMCGKLIHESIRAAGMGSINQTLGGLLGFGRGWVIGIALLMVPTTFVPQSRLIGTSVLSPYFFAVAHKVSFLVPQYLQRLFPYS